MLMRVCCVALAFRAALAGCNAGQPAPYDLCSKIPFFGKDGWYVNWPLPFLRDISGKLADGTAVRLNQIKISRVWITSCSLTGTKQNLTAEATGAGLQFQAVATGGKSANVQSQVELGKTFAQVLRCAKPDPSHSGTLHGSFHVEGDTLMSAIELAAFPETKWTATREAVMPVSASSDIDDILFHLVHPVAEAILSKSENSFDWCSVLAPVMGKSVHCTSDKVCDLEPLAKKFVSMPYKVTSLFNWVVASGDVYVDNPRITSVVSPKCSAHAQSPVDAQLTSSGLQVILQVDVKVHICVLWVFCHDLHPTTFVTITLPGTFQATVSQPDGLTSVRVAQSLQEFSVDAHWDEMRALATVAPGNSSADALKKCSEHLSKSNSTACDALAKEVAYEELAVAMRYGDLGIALRKSAAQFVGLQVDNAAWAFLEPTATAKGTNTINIDLLV